MELLLSSRIDQAASYIQSYLGQRVPRIGVVLGSGLGPLAEEIEDAVAIDFDAVPFMGKSTATGHEGRFVCGTLEGACVLVMQGRLHGYEGFSPQEIAFPIWVMHELGIEIMITTNAAGAINESYRVGDFCVMSDQINFTGRNPVVGQDPNQIAFRFFSMYECFDPELRAITRDVAKQIDANVHEGVYLGVLGPSFETAAEIRAFRTWGADTVAMSVCEEVLAARHVGMRVLGISLITNMGCGIEGASPTDDEVFEVGRVRERDFSRLVRGVIGSCA